MFDVHDAVRCATSPSSIPEGCLNAAADHGLTSGGNDRVIIVIFSFGVALKTRPYAGRGRPYRLIVKNLYPLVECNKKKHIKEIHIESNEMLRSRDKNWVDHVKNLVAGGGNREE